MPRFPPSLRCFSWAQTPGGSCCPQSTQHAISRGVASTAPPSTPSAPSPVRKIQAASHFTGNYLDIAWTRQFILGSLLQRFDPLRHNSTTTNSGGSGNALISSSISSASARAVEAALLDSQRVCSAIWRLPVRPLDALSESRILRLLARYASGEGLLSDDALQTMQHVLHRLPGAPANIADPVQMRTMLELIGYVEPGDNLNRVAYAGELTYPPQAHAFMAELLTGERQVDGGDAFDRLRERRPGPGYAIDSATTSEVDDAIGVVVDRETGARYFVVYVSDATVYCPFESELEQITARRLTTTTYLPEGVFFMLPKPIVEAATLREDRPCRTFNIVFQIDERTGELKNYRVAVGWLEQLRRITYDQVQELIDRAEKGRASPSPQQQQQQQQQQQYPPPAWMTETDKSDLLYILHCARVRLRVRLDRQRASAEAAAAATAPSSSSPPQPPSVDFNLPDPLVKVDGTHVVSVTDQVISTQDARLAVAELMIAANEVCSRVAQANHIAMPFRGTRALSSDHLVAHYYAEPQGVAHLTSLDASHVFLAEAMQVSARRLSTVTRAIYHHVPLYHAGLDTNFYAHSTSPLRRYADMLVHHQLKTWLWQQHRGSGGGADTSLGSSFFLRGAPQQFIPEHAMASLCAAISTKQEKASILQDSSTRFWVLKYLEDLERTAGGAGKRTYMCLVGSSRRVEAAPDYSRFASAAPDTSRLLSQPLPAADTPATPPRRRPATVCIDGDGGASSCDTRWSQAVPEYAFVSDLYLPEVQLVQTVLHHRADVRVGAVVECEVARVQPTQGVLQLRIRGVLAGGDERHYERLWMGALVSQLDA